MIASVFLLIWATVSTAVSTELGVWGIIKDESKSE
jgi:hypothetical protein